MFKTLLLTPVFSAKKFKSAKSAIFCSWVLFAFASKVCKAEELARVWVLSNAPLLLSLARAWAAMTPSLPKPVSTKVPSLKVKPHKVWPLPTEMVSPFLSFMFISLR